MQLSEEIIYRKGESIMKQLERLAKALNTLLMAFVAFASVIFLICGILTHLKRKYKGEVLAKRSLAYFSKIPQSFYE